MLNKYPLFYCTNLKIIKIRKVEFKMGKELIKVKVQGVYKIEDVMTGNVYVGSANDIGKRWSNNLAKLRNNKHTYKQLQEAWNDDCNRIKFEILEECSEDELAEREEYYFTYVDRIEGWTLINKTRDARRHKVKDVTKMCEAQGGSSNGNARLTEQDVMEILWLKENGYKPSEIADKYNISATYVLGVGKARWQHIDEMCKPKWVEIREVK